MKNKPEANEPKVTSHTPLPWISEKIAYDGYSASIRTMDPLSGRPYGLVAHLPGLGGTAEANAAFIVRAVNAHEELLAALKRFMAVIDYAEPSEETGNAKEQAEQAIAKAEGRK